MTFKNCRGRGAEGMAWHMEGSSSIAPSLGQWPWAVVITFFEPCASEDVALP